MVPQGVNCTLLDHIECVQTNLFSGSFNSFGTQLIKKAKKWKNDHTYVQELNHDRMCEDNHVTILHSDITPQQIQTVNVVNSMEGTEATDTGSISVQIKTATENSQNGLEHSKQGQSRSSIRTHTGKQFHLCSVCNKAFSNSQVFEQHTKHHNELNSVHCRICNRKLGKV